MKVENIDVNKMLEEARSMLKKEKNISSSFKAHSVYLSQFQLIPYNRIDDYFSEEINVPVSPGSIYNFNKEAYGLLEKFEVFVKQKLINSSVLNVDETG